MAGAPANEVFAGPDGAAGTPTFRKLVNADLPGGGGGGTVTSVGLALPAEFNVTGSPVTASGTLTGAWANENANEFLAGPSSGAAATPGFRAIVPADLPAATALAEGIIQLATDLGGTASAPEVVATHLASPLPVAQGGSGTATPSLVAGTNITISGSWPNQTVAASGGGAWTLISKQLVSSPVASVTFSSIPQTYTHLVLVASGRCSDASAEADCGIQLNGDTGANYSRIYAGSANGSQTGQTSMALMAWPAASGTANINGGSDIWFYDYTNTSFYKVLRGCVTDWAQTANYIITGQWSNTAAITDIKIQDNGGGNFIVGTVFSLYGVS